MKKFYIRDSRSCVGNCWLWWRKGSRGYTCNLEEAEVVDEEGAKAIFENRSTDIPYPKENIDARAVRHYQE